MDRLKFNARTAGFAACSAMAIALLAGCGGQSSVASTGTPPVSASAEATQNGAAIAKAEKRVARLPDNAAARVDLAQAYLAAGRFESATTTFEDARSLGQDDARTGLGLALSYIGSGRNREALAELGRWRDSIPASDYGLALALAGYPGEGVSVLTDTVRGGDDSPKARQNLAYAYALAGQWAQARVIAAQDVPADRLDARLNEWAQVARPQDYQSRVAGLIGAPSNVTDPGQPMALALGGTARVEQFAAAKAPAPVLAAPAEQGELAALDEAPVAPVMPAATEEPFKAAFASAPEPAKVASSEDAPRFVSRAVVQDVPAAATKPAITSTLASTYTARRKEAFSSGSHLIQLGSFRTREGAERAWGIFTARNPRLKDHTLRITEADVRGQRYYRVAAEGFDRSAAKDMCSSVKQKGGGCFAYAGDRELPGALPGKASAGGPLRAR